MSRYLLDTNVLIDFSRGKKAVVDHLFDLAHAGHILGSCAVCVAEFYAGEERGKLPDVDGFIDSLRRWPMSHEAAISGGAYRYTYARKGITLSVTDTMIAGVARHSNAVILTSNLKDYPMPDILVEPPPAAIA